MSTQGTVEFENDLFYADYLNRHIKEENLHLLEGTENGETTKLRIGWYQNFRRFLPIITFDLLSLVVVMLATYQLVNSKLYGGISEMASFLTHNLDRVAFYASLVILVFGLFNRNNLYEHRVIKTRVEQFFYICRSFLIADLVIIVFAFLFLNNTISESFKEFLIWFTILGICVTFLGRLIFRWLLQNNVWLSTLKPAKNIIVIGAGQAGKLYAAYLKHKIGNVNLTFFDDDSSKIGKKIFTFPVQGKPEDIIYSAIGKAEEICIVINEISKRRLLEIIQIAKRTSLPIKVWSSHYNMIFTGMYDKTNSLLQPIPIKNINNKQMDLSLKRFMDIILSAIGILLVFVPGLFIALLIRIDSNGPIFHESIRIGKDGKPFKMYKFRSMKVEVGNYHLSTAVARLKNGKHMGKVKNDPRITSIGAFLRKYSLDELPQLFNVLKGDMSMVGPRPCFQYEMELFENWHHRRFTMKPGITGLWQITGRQMGDLQLNDAMTTDVYYTDNYFLWLDFRILFRTIPVVFQGKGK